MSKHFSRFMQHRMRRKKSGTAELAAQLAPLEEQDRRAAERQGAQLEGDQPRREPGTIVVDTDRSMLPKEIAREEEKGFRKVEPVVLAVVGLMLAFIAFIAWQISEMPEP